MPTIRLTMAQALTRWMAAQSIRQFDGTAKPAFAGVWAIFGHGNVAGLGEALHAVKDQLPTFRGHNEQTMAHSAIAYAKQKSRRQMMAVTSSIGPGATNMVTAAALAHVNRLPVLFLPGDVFADRRPDPVLQQVESFADGTVSANDCFKPVCRYFDRITRPEQILKALPKAMSVLTDGAECGPVCLSLCQDVQAEAFDYPEQFFTPRIWEIQRPRADEQIMATAIEAIASARRPVILAGGGVKYSGAQARLKAFAEAGGIPVCATQAGKSVLAEDEPLYLGAVGVTGASAANKMIAQADLVLAIGTRLQDFTTGSNTLITSRLISLNIQTHDAIKGSALSLTGDADKGLEELGAGLKNYQTDPAYQAEIAEARAEWEQIVADVTDDMTTSQLPSDSQVIGAVNRAAPKHAIAVGAAGSMPGELHKLWQTGDVDGYHMEYGFSCMGYEVAAGLGVYMACPERPAIVFAGDGSYLMHNSELATAVMMGASFTLVITDNRGFGCINRLQAATGGAAFNNLFADSHHEILPEIDYVAHAASMGAHAVLATSLSELETSISDSIARGGVNVVVINTDPGPSTAAGGCWWDVGIPAVSEREEMASIHENYTTQRNRQIDNFS
ncbi:MAG: 3D-(3,5/4)-trihydroxycyclohexane-1,2-dione acylhydrolase (decyclizing) [Candidatus Puniceispirillaceae bacterium]